MVVEAERRRRLLVPVDVGLTNELFIILITNIVLTIHHLKEVAR